MQIFVFIAAICEYFSTKAMQIAGFSSSKLLC